MLEFDTQEAAQAYVDSIDEQCGFHGVTVTWAIPTFDETLGRWVVPEHICGGGDGD